MYQIVIVALFFLIIAVLVIMASIGSYRERQTKKSRDFQQKKLHVETQDDLRKIMINVGIYIKELEKFLEKHDPLKGNVSLGKINSFGSKIIQDINHSEELKKIFMDETKKEELKELFEGLTKVKPSNWMRDSYESYNILKAKANVFINDESNSVVYKNMKEEYEKKFTEYISNS